MLGRVPCLFQSLFFWIHFYNLAAVDEIAVHSAFQSLFFWIHFYNSSGLVSSA